MRPGCVPEWVLSKGAVLAGGMGSETLVSRAGLGMDLLKCNSLFMTQHFMLTVLQSLTNSGMVVGSPKRVTQIKSSLRQ